MFDVIKEKCGQSLIVSTEAELEAAMDKVKPTRVFSIDIETFGDEDKPGDSAVSPHHGIAGIALTSSNGDAMYIVTGENGRPGVRMENVAYYLNAYWLRPGSRVVLHHGKFDWGFLLSRGLVIPAGCSVTDTWVLNSIRTEGIFSTSKLKELMKERFQIVTEGKDLVDEWLTANNTKDYGKIPVDIAGPYAQDDVRYTLMLLFGQPAMNEDESANHDLHIRNSFSINKAEQRGMRVNLPLMKKNVTDAVAQLEQHVSAVRCALGATQVDPLNDQDMLKLLHNQNLHPKPRMMYGEERYVYDAEAMEDSAQSNNLAAAYRNLHITRTFLRYFSGNYGDARHRIKMDGNDGIFHPSFHQSIGTQGGIVHCKFPDLVDGMTLNNAMRELFVPRDGKEFVVFNPQHPFQTVLAYYCQDNEMKDWIRQGNDPAVLMHTRSELALDACKIIGRTVIEGSGKFLLGERLSRAKVRGAGGKGHLGMYDRYLASITGYNAFTQKLQQNLNSPESVVRDRFRRRLRINQDKRWRAEAILLKSSVGSLLSYYLDIFCRAAEATNAALVFAHDGEYVFEVDRGSKEFWELCRELCSRKLPIEPTFTWHVNQIPNWTSQ